MINNAVLVGRLTRDPELRKTQSGTSVVSFNLAVNRRFKTEEQTADFINCVAWNQTADFMSKYLRKGNLISVEGRIQTRNYEDKTGNRVYVTEIVAEQVQGLESKQNREDVQNEVHEVEQEKISNSTLDISSYDLPF